MSLRLKSSHKGTFKIGEITRHPKLGMLRIMSVREIRAHGKVLHYEFLAFPFEEVEPEAPIVTPTLPDPIPTHDRRQESERRDWTQRTWDYLRSWR